ncbi:MAG: hypothetical protein N838_07605 [Thiohalocapsa sp. PB-PSB1]|nr:MAG: hypothetical protein N838_07605 [Thiohalocapsa sp. PB-PSB1]
MGLDETTISCVAMAAQTSAIWIVMGFVRLPCKLGTADSNHQFNKALNYSWSG